MKNIKISFKKPSQDVRKMILEFEKKLKTHPKVRTLAQAVFLARLFFEATKEQVRGGEFYMERKKMADEVRGCLKSVTDYNTLYKDIFFKIIYKKRQGSLGMEKLCFYRLNLPLFQEFFYCPWVELRLKNCDILYKEFIHMQENVEIPMNTPSKNESYPHYPQGSNPQKTGNTLLVWKSPHKECGRVHTRSVEYIDNNYETAMRQESDKLLSGVYSDSGDSSGRSEPMADSGIASLEASLPEPPLERVEERPLRFGSFANLMTRLKLDGYQYAAIAEPHLDPYRIRYERGVCDIVCFPAYPVNSIDSPFVAMQKKNIIAFRQSNALDIFAEIVKSKLEEDGSSWNITLRKEIIKNA